MSWKTWKLFGYRSKQGSEPGRWAGDLVLRDTSRSPAGGMCPMEAITEVRYRRLGLSQRPA